MKKITRTIIFTTIAVYLTSLWNPGFNISTNIVELLKISLVISSILHFLHPLLKVLLIPFNVLTFGLIGAVVNILLFYFIITSILDIPIYGWQIGSYTISPLMNIVIVSFSISFITNMLKYLL